MNLSGNQGAGDSQARPGKPECVHDREETGHPAIARTVHRSAVWLENFIEKHKYILIAIWTVLTFLCMIGHSRRKPMWLDETLFVWIASRDSYAQIWSALRDGINLDPPLAHLLTHHLFAVFGQSAAVARLPAMLGFLVMCLGIAACVRKSAGMLYASAALILPFSTSLWPYALEARPYGLTFGFCALTFFCWQKACEANSGWRWAAGLSISLACALSCQFFAVFLLVAIFTAEALEFWFTRKPPYARLAATIAGMLPLLAYLPIMRSGREFAIAYFAKASWARVAEFFGGNSWRASSGLVVFFVLATIMYILDLAVSSSSPDRFSPDLRRSLAFSLGLIVIPFVALLAGYLWIEVFLGRYVLYSVVGFLAAAPLLVWRSLGRSALPGLCLLAAFGVKAAYLEGGGLARLRGPEAIDGAALALQQMQVGEGRDIVVASHLDFLPLCHYAPPELSSRLVYLYDVRKSASLIGEDTMDRVYQKLALRTNLRILPFEEYVAGAKRLSVFTSDRLGWLKTYLKRHAKKGSTIDEIGGASLAEFELP